MTTAKTKSTASLTLTIFSYCLGSNFFLHTVVYLVLNSFHMKDTLKQPLFCGWILFCCCFLGFFFFVLLFYFLWFFLFLFFLWNNNGSSWGSYITVSLPSSPCVRSSVCLVWTNRMRWAHVPSDPLMVLSSHRGCTLLRL